VGRSFNFSIVRLAPGGVRDERINVGLAIFREDGVDVRLPATLGKIRAISGALDQSAIRELAKAIDDRDTEIRTAGIDDPEARVRAIGNLGPIQLSELGTFQSNSLSEYEDRVAAIFRSIVDPEPASRTFRSKKSRLLTDLKKLLRSQRVLAKGDEDIRSHRIVSNYSLAEGLTADLALKNGVMHIVETVDVSSDDATARKAVSDIAVSALVLEQARINFGANGTKTRLVYSAMPTVETAAKTCLEAAEHQGAQLYNWASSADQISLIYSLSKLAIPRETAADRRRRLEQGDGARLKMA